MVSILFLSHKVKAEKNKLAKDKTRTNLITGHLEKTIKLLSSPIGHALYYETFMKIMRQIISYDPSHTYKFDKYIQSLENSI